MLIDSPILEPVLNPVSAYPMQYIKPQPNELDAEVDCTAQAIVDRDPDSGEDRFLAALSGKYALVKNSELLSALDLAASEAGANLRPQSARYFNGRSEVVLELPGFEYQPPGDPSNTTPTINLYNDYRGGLALNLFAGAIRGICTNGMVFGHVLTRRRRVHTGRVQQEIMAYAQEAVNGIADAALAAKLTAEFAVEHKLTDEAVNEWLDRLEEGTAKKYQASLTRAVDENLRALGQNAWGLTQAISEVATHTMPTSNASVDWRDAWVDKVLDGLGVTSGVRAAVKAARR